MIKHTNTACPWSSFDHDTQDWVVCGEPPWVLPNGLRVNTPHCEKHAEQWSEWRMRDPEANAR